jgi:hypothetical protein
LLDLAAFSGAAVNQTKAQNVINQGNSPNSLLVRAQQLADY